MEEEEYFRPMSCVGEFCYCGNMAFHKIEEVIFHDDPCQNRHPFTAYLCDDCFKEIMGIDNV